MTVYRSLLQLCFFGEAGRVTGFVIGLNNVHCAVSTWMGEAMLDVDLVGDHNNNDWQLVEGLTIAAFGCVFYKTVY